VRVQDGIIQNHIPETEEGGRGSNIEKKREKGGIKTSLSPHHTSTGTRELFIVFLISYI